MYTSLLLVFSWIAIIVFTSASEDDLLVVTVATEETDGFKRFMRSARKYGLNVKVLGLGHEWKGGDVKRYPGGGHKVNLLKEELEHYKDEDSLLVLFTDSYDVVFTDGAQVIKDRFAKFDARVVFSAEEFCWPDSSLKDKYPPVKASEKRFLNSGGFIGYAKELYQIVRYSNIQDGGDDQAYYTSIYLDRAQRGKWNIKLDSRSEIFQNLNGALGDITIKYKGNHSYLYNIETGTVPVLIHGNGPIKVEFNRLANYLADGWTANDGCLACKEDTISLNGVKLEDYPTVLMALYLEQPTPFISEFFKKIAALKYPKDKIYLYIHNKEEFHRKDVDNFIKEYGSQYRSFTQISPSHNVGEEMGRNWGLEECIEKSCQYYFSVDSLAQISNPEILTDLIEQNRTIIAPMLLRPGKFWSNFWGALSQNGFYVRSEDYMDIVEDKRIGLWNVPYLMNVYLIQGHRVNDLRGAHTYNSDVDPDMSFCEKARDLGYFMFVTNQHKYGHLISPDNFETNHPFSDLYNLFENTYDWEQKYLHENYSKALKPNAVVEQFSRRNHSEMEVFRSPEDIEPCPDVYWFPIVTDTFCDEFVATMEESGKWSNGGHSDPRLAGGYENVPTVDIHMNQVGFERHWLHMLASYIRPLQERVFIGYFHNPPHAIMNFIVRYRPDEQPSLRPHHDSSTYTINIALNRPGIDFEGGGCRFIRYNCSITSPRKGWMFMHPGRLTHYHEGLTVTKGTRYIMVSFVDP